MFEDFEGRPAFKKARVRLRRLSPRPLRFRESRRQAQLFPQEDNSKTLLPDGWDKIAKT